MLKRKGKNAITPTNVPNGKVEYDKGEKVLYYYSVFK